MKKIPLYPTGPIRSKKHPGKIYRYLPLSKTWQWVEVEGAAEIQALLMEAAKLRRHKRAAGSFVVTN